MVSYVLTEGVWVWTHSVILKSHAHSMLKNILSTCKHNDAMKPICPCVDAGILICSRQSRKTNLLLSLIGDQKNEYIQKQNDFGHICQCKQLSSWCNICVLTGKPTPQHLTSPNPISVSTHKCKQRSTTGSCCSIWRGCGRAADVKWVPLLSSHSAHWAISSLELEQCLDGNLPICWSCSPSSAAQIISNNEKNFVQACGYERQSVDMRKRRDWGEEVVVGRVGEASSGWTCWRSNSVCLPL